MALEQILAQFVAVMVFGTYAGVAAGMLYTSEPVAIFIINIACVIFKIFFLLAVLDIGSGHLARLPKIGPKITSRILRMEKAVAEISALPWILTILVFLPWGCGLSVMAAKLNHGNGRLVCLSCIALGSALQTLLILIFGLVASNILGTTAGIGIAIIFVALLTTAVKHEISQRWPSL